MNNAYTGQPEYVDGIPIYPVRYREWKRFDEIGVPLLSIGDKYIENRVKVNVSVYDYFSFVILQNIRNGGKDSHKTLNEFTEMLSIITRSHVEPVYELDMNILIFKVGEKKSVISRNNFDAIHEIVNRHNLIFEPLTSKDDFSNKMIQKSLANKNKNAKPMDLDVMFMAVTTLSPGYINENEITYYALRAKYELINRKMTNELYSMAIAQGNKMELIEYAEKLKIEENPYTQDKVFVKSNSTDNHQV